MSRARPHERILFATIGSLGDLHPCLALGLELQRRGYVVTIACTEHYRAKIESLGIAFHPMRPHWDPTDRDLIRQCEDMRSGIEVLFRKLILPGLRETYDDLLAAAQTADLMIAGELVFAAPLVAEKLGLSWVSAILSPASLLSAHDPSVLVNVPGLIHVRRAGWRAYRAALSFGRLLTRHWWQPVRLLRRELGLRADCDPLFRDKFSPHLVLALFSRRLAEPQRDWPPHTIQPGFVFYDQPGTPVVPDTRLADFLAAGPAPIVFTLGSAAVNNPGEFYRVSVQAAQRLGRRALLLLGTNQPPVLDSLDVLSLPYAPFSQVFHQAAAIVHQGGSGTTGQAMRAGRPMLIVPYGWDQPDNGSRIERVGAGICLPRAAYTADGATRCLQRLLTDPAIVSRAAGLSDQLAREDALTAACDAVESIFPA